MTQDDTGKTKVQKVRMVNNGGGPVTFKQLSLLAAAFGGLIVLLFTLIGQAHDSSLQASLGDAVEKTLTKCRDEWRRDLAVHSTVPHPASVSKREFDKGMARQQRIETKVDAILLQVK